jgi:hypothetical protein
MKKNLIICTLVVCCAVFFASCVTISKTESGNTRNIVGLGVTQIPTVATLEVSSTKVTELFTVKAKNKFSMPILSFGKKNDAMLLSKEKAVESVKAHAVAKMLVKFNADVLIEPRFAFETVSTNKSTTYNIIVSGYPGTYKNFRTATVADKELLEITPTLLEIKPTILEPRTLIGTLEAE